jgi:hypothetical protein
MNPTPQSQLDASLLGKIIGHNNNSGLLYTTQNGLSQFSPPSNVIPKGNDFSSYRNEANETNTLEAMNSKEGSPPNYYEGKKDRLVVKNEQQPEPFTILGGQPQEPQTKAKIVIPKLGEIDKPE